MAEQVSTCRKHRARTRRSPYRELIHLLNQRYHDEWVRAEALQFKLDRLRRWKLLPLLEWIGRIGRRLCSIGRHSSKSTLMGQAVPYVASENLDPPTGLVSIVIPFKDRHELLRNCLRSFSAGSYRRFEVILVDNGSAQSRTRRLLDRYGARPGVQVVADPNSFNFSRLCNLGADRASGDYLLFLNNDTEVLDRDWLEQLMSIAADPMVGAVGATLLYPDRTIQHAGLFPRSDGVWVHPYRGEREDFAGERNELRTARCVPAVTAACLMIRRDLFQTIGGFDERFAVMYNDADLCMRIRDGGLRVVVTPKARLIHYESLSRGYMLDEADRPDSR